METGRPADVLPDREAGHGGAMADARTRGRRWSAGTGPAPTPPPSAAAAPDAAQVADRWHLWHNLCQYAGKAVARHRECISRSRLRLPGPGR